MKFVSKKSILAYLTYILPLTILMGCQSIPDKGFATDDDINWLQEARQAKSYDAFILALVSMMDLNLSEELASFYQFYDSKGELITSQRFEKSRMNLICPDPSRDWIYLANYEVADGYRVNFRVEDDSDLFWCGLSVGQKDDKYFISDIVDYRSNISVVSALESFEALPPFEIKSTTRSTKTSGVRGLLNTEMSPSEWDQLITKYKLDRKNDLLLAVQARQLTRPVSDESMEVYLELFETSKSQDEWPLQQFYQQLGLGASEDQLIAYADKFTHLTSDPVWPYIFWSRVAVASEDFELSERLLQIALFNDPLNDLPYFGLMRTYAEQAEYGHLLQVRSLLESKFAYRIDPEYFFEQEGYTDFVLSKNFKNWAEQR